MWGLASYKESPASFVWSNFSEFSVLLPDYPYHNGLGDVGMDLWSLRSVSEYLLPLLEYEGFKEFHGVGFSFGGLVLLDLANILNGRAGLVTNVNNCQLSQAICHNSLLREPSLCSGRIHPPPSGGTFTQGIIKKMVIWASPILGDNGITNVYKLLSDVYLKIPDEKLLLLHDSEVVKTGLMRRGIKPPHPLWAKKYLQIVKSTGFVNLPDSIRQLYIYDPSDTIVSNKNAIYVSRLVEAMRVGLIEIAQIRGGGHFGTKKGRQMAIQLIKSFLGQSSQFVG